MNWEDPQDLSATAGEYVLGTLPDSERRSVVEEMRSNAELAAEVARWQDRLLGLTRRVPPAVPSNSLWARIDADLPAATSASPAAPARPMQAEQAVRQRAPAANESVWNKVGLWKTLSGLAIAACLVLATLLVVNPASRTSEARYLAVLQSPDKQAGWVVEMSSAAPLKLVPIIPGQTVPEGRAYQFWTKIDGAAGPTSLGLVKPGEPLLVDVSKLPGVVDNQLFEITLEPPTGSPINKPTGPVLFIGRSVKV